MNKNKRGWRRGTGRKRSRKFCLKKEENVFKKKKKKENENTNKRKTKKQKSPRKKYERFTLISFLSFCTT